MNDYEQLVLSTIREVKDDVKEIRRAQSDQDKRIDRLEQGAKKIGMIFGSIAAAVMTAVIAIIRSNFFERH